MFKGFWLHSKNHLQKFNITKSGILLLICLIFCYSTSFSLDSSTNSSTLITADKIQKLAEQYQGDTKKRFLAWAKLLRTAKNKPINEQLEDVNSFFNQFAYVDDPDDYWKSPQEFIIDGGGDCEDFAIIKYFTLLSLGIPEERLRITYAILLTVNTAHMILAYYPTPESEPLILDSQESKILTASKRRDLKPIYSFNGEGLWLAKQRGESSLIGEPQSINKWDELLKRLKQ